MSAGGSTESNVRSFEALLTVYLSIPNYTKCLIIKLSLLKKNPLKKRKKEIITQCLKVVLLWCNTSRSCARMTDLKIKNSKMVVQH
jgi:hypothetical protein